MARMNIYSQKQRWKLLLFALALVIVGVSLWYTKSIIDKISEEERKKVEIWAEAVTKRSALVNYTSGLFEKLEEGERGKVRLTLEATKYLARPDVTDVSFALNVLNDNTTVPVILTNDQGEITTHRNIELPDENPKAFLRAQLAEMRSLYDPIEITYYGNNKVYLYYKDSKLFSELKTTFKDLQKSFISELVINAASSPVLLVDDTRQKIIEAGNVDTSLLSEPGQLKAKLSSMELPIRIDLDGKPAYVYYEDSYLLTQLKYYPIAQLGIIGLFIFIAYLLFSTARKAEQNQVWVGMSKETAHQLGTPLSSMIAWVELLKEEASTRTIGQELEKDVQRLQVVTERFSKIGSQPEMKYQNLVLILQNVVDYFQKRISSKTTLTFEVEEDVSEVLATVNTSLFEWVIENLIKNAIDAMEGKGEIHVRLSTSGQKVVVDVSDTGKGIPASKFKTIFEPGFTTKKRGWGLGLSLSKRIIRDYHSGRIFVHKSELGEGTTFRIMLQS